jgi:hypothetical protein
MALAGGFGSIRHLAGRFFGSLSPRRPGVADETWALSHMLEGERQLYRRMSAADQRHAIAVARRAVALLGSKAELDRAVVASALLHDVGKVASDLGPFSRAIVTVCALVLGRHRVIESGRTTRWEGSPLKRAQMYLSHDRIGGALLREAGSDALTVAWAEQHHLPAERWTIGTREGQALKAADDD